ncbi:cobalamin synthesis protein P47K [Candidatus Moduliflexus flocculans]|uniref:Cobalamin synthesis protein P47K n=1 Tax=Candidatus Moduliflexus flocculans TaxID=1499966 RepID=A0A081BRJ3_9BACT|nr:cobalamin synthesis protein P47K [Candidatus Moduliflexus flocculans]
MNIYIVGGFLGSGKTTAIISAAKQLLRQGKRVGVVTNDQGKYLVDTAFVSLNDIPTVEVSGGCFCCNYDDLETHLEKLNADAAPDVIFAESVGSCADVVATVLKPLSTFRHIPYEQLVLTVFADSRLLLRRLRGLPLVFSDDVCYIFDKQLEEAGLIVMNKSDLLNAEDRTELEHLAQRHFPAASFRLQNSLESNSVSAWLHELETISRGFPEQSLEIDYARYGGGEAKLAWLDQDISFVVPPGQGRAALLLLIGAIIDALRRQNAPIGHVKFLAKGDTYEQKISFVTLAAPDWEEALPETPDTRFTLLINARVETEAQALRQLVRDAINHAAQQGEFAVQEGRISAFHPAMPRPTHRLT